MDLLYELIGCSLPVDLELGDFHQLIAEGDENVLEDIITVAYRATG